MLQSGGVTASGYAMLRPNNAQLVRQQHDDALQFARRRRKRASELMGRVDGTPGDVMLLNGAAPTAPSPAASLRPLAEPVVATALAPNASATPSVLCEEAWGKRTRRAKVVANVEPWLGHVGKGSNACELGVLTLPRICCDMQVRAVAAILATRLSVQCTAPTVRTISYSISPPPPPGAAGDISSHALERQHRQLLSKILLRSEG